MNKRRLYESIMRNVSKTVKRALNEDYLDPSIKWMNNTFFYTDKAVEDKLWSEISRSWEIDSIQAPLFIRLIEHDDADVRLTMNGYETEVMFLEGMEQLSNKQMQILVAYIVDHCETLTKFVCVFDDLDNVPDIMLRRAIDLEQVIK